ncbi:MAG: carboxypeptidase-like regulatory domain-containing protein [Niabella sp.]
MQDDHNIYLYSPEDIGRYLSGSMSAQEMHDLERAALSDPMLADAIDGFRKADKKITAQHLDDISTKILSGASQHPNEQAPIVPLKSNNNKNRQWRLWAAASVLGIIAAGSWWLMKPATVAPAVKDIARNLPVTDNDHLPADIPGSQQQNSSTAFVSDSLKQTGMSAPARDKKLNPPPSNIIKAEKSPAPVVVDERSVSNPAEEGLKADNRILAQEQLPADSLSPFSPEVGINNKEIATNLTVLSKEPIAYHPNIARKKVSNYNTSLWAPSTKVLTGRVTDEKGQPLAAALIQAAYHDNNATTTKTDGSFVLPVTDTTNNILVSMSGYKQMTANLEPGKSNNIVLPKIEGNHVNDVVVIGYNAQKKKGISGDYGQFKKQTANLKMLPYPEDGWTNFYEDLSADLGVDKSRPTKTLQIKFTVDDEGEPVNFTIVESPDEILTRKTIEFIKKAKWKNFKLNKNAVVKIEVN